MSRLSWLYVEDFKKISCVEFDISGVTEISGPNGSGKSSGLDSISVLIDGLAAAPAEPIRNGKQKSLIKGRFGEMTVIRHIERAPSGKHTTRVQFQPAGEKPHPATQKQLTELIGEHRLDPMDFLALESKDKFKAFQAFVPGFDFAKSKERDDADYLRRTEVNRTAKMARAAAELISVPHGLPSEPIDERALVDALARAGEHNAAIETRKGNRQRAADDVARARAAAQAALAGIPDAVAKVKAQNEQLVTSLKSRIADLEDQLIDLREQLSNTELLGVRTAENAEALLRGEAATHTMKADDLQKHIDEAPALPEPVDIAALRIRIEKARETNAAILRAGERGKHIKAAEEAEIESKELTESMNARRDAREAAIAAARIPIPGLEFGDGEIRLHGSPFEQASTAQKLAAAFAYCVACNPSLRLIWIKDASLLDDSTYAEINRLASEFDCDVLLETVRSIGGNSIVLEDGHIRDAQESAVSHTIIFDSEWTGREEVREAIEIAYLTLRGAGDLFGSVDDAIPEPLSVAASFCQRFKPSIPITYGAMAVHHILPEELEACEPSSSFTLPADVRYMVGHAIDGDWKTIGSPNLRRICTYAMAQHIWPDADSHSQSALLYMLNGATLNQRRLLRGAHGALVDAENNLALLEHILLAKPDLCTWSALWQFSEEARIPVYAPLKRWDGIKLADMDDGAIRWCLAQEWLDPYFRTGLERVIEQRRPRRPTAPRELVTANDLDDSDIPF